ncbi:hypothetical protein R3P38DRAFT_2932432 [Favolaschia claudopus]|uniref:Uncharacterized protein n=1 Tax=Favolaschia claudopus TaxID=2862362 RepID=A0AAW0BSZ7_9AGAR
MTALCRLGSEAYDDALAPIARSLNASQETGLHVSMAQSLELLAYTCAARLDLSGARVAYEGAVAQFAKRKKGRVGRHGVARCAENVEKLRELTDLDGGSFANLMKPVPWS